MAVAIALLLGLGTALSTAVPAAAGVIGNLEQGSITMSGVGTTTLYPCVSGCPIPFTGVSTAQINGTDSAGNPYTLSWAASSALVGSMSLNISIANTCGSSWPEPLVTAVSGTINVSGAVLAYHGAAAMAAVSVQFGTSVLAQADTYVINSLIVSAQGSNGSVSFLAGTTGGVLTLVPVGVNLCQPPSTMTFQANGTLLSAL